MRTSAGVSLACPSVALVWHLAFRLVLLAMSRKRLVELPIDPLLPRIVEAVCEEGVLVLQAEPGAGKTTRIPPALLEISGQKEILVLEPRRIAARLAAVRVAEELGEAVGGTVGYQVRHENMSGPATRLRFVTEGIFTRRLIDDPMLEGLGILVLDEFHERSLHSDLALAVAKALRERTRPDLRLVVMSATIEAVAIAEHLGGAPVIQAEGRAHPVEIEHLDRPDERALEKRVAAAVRSVVRETDEAANGSFADILVFLPGAAQIRRVGELLEPFAGQRDLELVPLHGALSAGDQDRAVRRGERRKVILATNVAETSITLPSVTTVVDTGLFRLASYSPWTGLPSLEVRPVSRASAAQRAGRAGRVAPGRCVRLYSKHDLLARPAETAPEIERVDLSELCLSLSASGIPDPLELPWLDRPPEPALKAARTLLSRLGAVGEFGAPTEIGEEMARFPVHPRQARLLVEAGRRGVYSPACAIAALLGERDVFAVGKDLVSTEARTVGPCDLLERYERVREAGALGGRWKGDGARRLGLDPGVLRRVKRAFSQLLRLGGEKEPFVGRQPLSQEEETALRICVLSAWPDRVAKRRRPGESAFVLAEGGEVRLSLASVVREADWLVAVDATYRGKSVSVHLATAIEADWLLDLFPERVREGLEVTWNAKARRVEAHSRMLFEEAVLMESRERASDLPEASRLLAEQARRAGIEAFADPRAVENIAGRLRVAAVGRPEGGYSYLEDCPGDPSAASSVVESPGVQGEAIERLCEGRTRFDELSTEGLIEAILAPLSPRARAELEELAPTHIALPGRRRAPVHYPAGAKPHVASRIQDFFGLKETPRIARGSVELVVHLLAPNGRPVQVTQDLAGFWKRHYPEIRRELSRRYPRHAWPEEPG